LTGVRRGVVFRRDHRVVVSIAVALLAAAVFAIAANLQHRVTRPAGGLAPLALAARILAHPVWLAGFLANFVGFLLHALALRRGDVGVVQAVLVVQLLFALPLATLRTGARPRLRDWLGTAAVCAGIATLALTRHDVEQVIGPRDGLAVGGFGLLAIATLVTASRLCQRWPPLRTALLGLSAGTCFSITATFIVLVVRHITAVGLWRGLLDWPTVGLFASGLTAAILVQWSFASGSLPAALTAMTVGDPLSSWIWSTVLFDAVPAPDPLVFALAATAGVAMVSGVALLAYSPILRDDLAARATHGIPARASAPAAEQPLPVRLGDG
jgi:drug/metabolite transporter (DMT)-like permease